MAGRVAIHKRACGAGNLVYSAIRTRRNHSDKFGTGRFGLIKSCTSCPFLPSHRLRISVLGLIQWFQTSLQVSKAWNFLFTSPELCRKALRQHFPQEDRPDPADESVANRVLLRLTKTLHAFNTGRPYRKFTITHHPEVRTIDEARATRLWSAYCSGKIAWRRGRTVMVRCLSSGHTTGVSLLIGARSRKILLSNLLLVIVYDRG